MPTVVNRKTNALEVVASCEWSWPDHPDGMSDAEARMRMPRASTDTGPREEQARIDERTLAAKYGELLEAGQARVQQTTHSGDSLPRNVNGHLLSIKQEMAADLVEHKAGWTPEVYDTERQVVKYPGATPPAAWGAPNRNHMSTWLPQDDSRDNAGAAVIASRALKGATSSMAAADVAWCKNLRLDDGGAIWREAVARGRAVEGNPDDLRKCAARIPAGIEISPEENRKAFETEQYGPVIDLYVPQPQGSDAEQARAELYAAARGNLCTEYGPPLGEDEKALDALAASIVASRGTNSAGLGWSPPEPELLREAGRELQRSPERLDEVVDRVITIEHQLYPPWPERERVHERTPDLRPVTADPQPLDREHHRHHHEAERWREQQARTSAERTPLKLGDEPPPPERAPAPNRDAPREQTPEHAGIAR